MISGWCAVAGNIDIKSWLLLVVPGLAPPQSFLQGPSIVRSTLQPAAGMALPGGGVEAMLSNAWGDLMILAAGATVSCCLSFALILFRQEVVTVCEAQLSPGTAAAFTAAYLAALQASLVIAVLATVSDSFSWVSGARAIPWRQRCQCTPVA